MPVTQIKLDFRAKLQLHLQVLKQNDKNIYIYIYNVIKQKLRYAGPLTCEFSSILFVFGGNQRVQLLPKCLQIFFFFHV